MNEVYYIADTSLTNKSAYTHHVIKMCDAFSQKKNTTLVIPFLKKKNIYNSIKKNYLLTSKRKFLIFSILNFKPINFFHRIFFAYKVANYLKDKNSNLILTRSFMTSIFLTIFSINHIIEIHSELRGLTKFLLINLNFINSKYILKIIFISKALKKKFRIENKYKILILHDAVDIKNFKKIRNSEKIKFVSYVGSFHKGKGVEVIYELAKKFKKLFFNVYGDKLDNKFKILKNIKFYGFINYSDVPSSLSKSDLLLLPSQEVQYGRSSSVNISNYNSPLKMFDYLAAGKVIVSSKLDGICEILKHNQNSILVNGFEVSAWETTIKNILLKNYNLKKIRRNSTKTAKKFTWIKRVENILLAYHPLKK